jgi:radical SAM protein with 4Fe4S-binding SPASM domain
MNHKKKFFLFKESKHFCAVPWNHFEIWTNGDVRTCSKGHAFGNINEQSLDQVLQAPDIQTIKQDLLQDTLNQNCTDCHRLTTGTEHFDLRNHYNPMFKNFDINYDDTTAFELNGVDLHWDNTCNFKCVYCNPSQSSLIAQEQGVSIDRSDSANIDDIIARIEKNQFSIKEIYFSGGEPLLVKHNVKLLKKLTNTQLPIRINSNISQAIDSNLVFSELKRFQNVLWTVSADCMGEKFNYVRHGGNWDQFLNNLKTIKTLGHGIRLNLVWFVGSVSSLSNTIRYFVQEHGITDITINQLYKHQYLRARHAPVAIKQLAYTQIHQLLTSGLIEEKSNTWYNIARCTQELETTGSDPSGYVEYFNHLDQLRGTNWRQAFPELAV